MNTQTINPLRMFDPAETAKLETANWVAYYQKDWDTLARVSVQFVKQLFALSDAQAARGAALVATAEIAAAPFPDNDMPTAERAMTEFYQLVKDAHGLAFDPAETARLDCRWWVIHRQLFADPKNAPLIEALMDFNAALYGGARERYNASAFYRAEAMQHSDRWVREGRAPGSELIREVEGALRLAYEELREALGGAAVED